MNSVDCYWDAMAPEFRAMIEGAVLRQVFVGEPLPWWARQELVYRKWLYSGKPNPSPSQETE